MISNKFVLLIVDCLCVSSIFVLMAKDASSIHVLTLGSQFPKQTTTNKKKKKILLQQCLGYLKNIYLFIVNLFLLPNLPSLILHLFVFYNQWRFIMAIWSTANSNIRLSKIESNKFDQMSIRTLK